MVMQVLVVECGADDDEGFRRVEAAQIATAGTDG